MNGGTKTGFRVQTASKADVRQAEFPPAPQKKKKKKKKYAYYFTR
jgi:hypothetical protein